MVAVRLTVLLGLLATAGASTGQVLVIDQNIGAAANGPARNATMGEVESRFGAPERRTGPVGEPPITVWHYERFKVYFEHDRVLHSTSRVKSATSP